VFLLENRVNIYSPEIPFNVSDGQVSQYKGITYCISTMNTRWYSWQSNSGIVVQ